MIDKQNNANVEIIAHLGSLEHCVLEVRIPQPEQSSIANEAIRAWDEPVCGQGPCLVPIYAWIAKDNNCENPCATPAQVNQAVATANTIFGQCDPHIDPDIEFTLYGTGDLCKTVHKVVDFRTAEPNTICSNYRAGASVNVYFVCSLIHPLPGRIACGAGNPATCCIFIDASPTSPPCCPEPGNILAHELGHILGLGHETTALDYCNLMFSPDRFCCSTLTSDQCSIALTTCQAGGCWT